MPYLNLLSQDELDKRSILNILIYSASGRENPSHGMYQLPRDGKRLRRSDETMDIERLLNLEWLAEAGDLALSGQ